MTVMTFRTDSKSSFSPETVSVSTSDTRRDKAHFCLGPEVTAQAVRALETVSKASGLTLELESCDFGGIAIDNHNEPLPDETLRKCKEADAILLGESPNDHSPRSMPDSRPQGLWVDPNGVLDLSGLNKVS